MSTVTDEDLAKLTETTLGGLRVERVSETDAFINLLVYGDSGVGKTRLAGSASEVMEMSPVLLIDIEGGKLTLRESYPDVDVVRVKTWKQMQAVYDELYRETSYKTIILDSLTEIQKFSMYTIMLDLVRKEPDRDPDVPSVREWGKNVEQIRKLVRAFRDLPCNTLFTALRAEEKNPRTGMAHSRPSLSGKLAAEVAAFVDVVGYMYVKEHEGEMKRLLLTQATEQQVAKDRTARLSPVLEQPTMQKIYDNIFNPNEQETNGNQS